MEAVEGLNKTTHDKFEKIWDINDKKIQLKCGEVQRQLEVGRIIGGITVHDGSTSLS